MPTNDHGIMAIVFQYFSLLFHVRDLGKGCINDVFFVGLLCEGRLWIMYCNDYVFAWHFRQLPFQECSERWSLILHAGAPPKNTKIQTQILHPRSLIVSVHGQYYHVPSWDQTHVEPAYGDEMSFCGKTVGGMEMILTRNHSTPVLQGRFWILTQFPLA